MDTGQPSLARKIGASLEVLTNLLYLANVNAENRVQSVCYMTLAEEKLAELVKLIPMPKKRRGEPIALDKQARAVSLHLRDCAPLAQDQGIGCGG
jgi:hypothetical protein